MRTPPCDKVGIKKGPWNPEEDQILINHVNLYGHGNWRALPKLAGLLRCGKSCRLRWVNYLSPNVKRGNLSEEEEQTVIRLHRELGNRWSAIAAELPGRTDNHIKNLWHTYIKKKVLLQKEGGNNDQDVAAAVAVESNGLRLSSGNNEDEEIWSSMVSDFVAPTSPKCLSVIGNSSKAENTGSGPYSGDFFGFREPDEFWVGGTREPGSDPGLIPCPRPPDDKSAAAAAAAADTASSLGDCNGWLDFSTKADDDLPASF